jgi:hypothetical protein
LFPNLYREACRPRQLTGERISRDKIPRLVCRLFTWLDIQRRIAEALNLDMPIIRDQIQLSVGTDSWQNANVAVRIRGKPPADLRIRCAGGGPGSDTWAVFVAFEVESEATPKTVTGPQNVLWQRLQAEATRTAVGLAACAVRLLGLDPPTVRPGNQPHLLAEYASASYDDWRYPVLPDARYNSLFRPVPPGSAWQYGRTFCRGASEADWLAGKVGTNEAVHPNEELPFRAMDMIFLGEA